MSSLRLTYKLCYVYAFLYCPLLQKFSMQPNKLFSILDMQCCEVSDQIMRINVSDFIISAPFEPNLFLGKSISCVQHLVISIVVQGSALQINLPYVRETLVQCRLSGRAAVTGIMNICQRQMSEHHKLLCHIVWSVTEKYIRKNIMYLHAHADTSAVQMGFFVQS